MDDPAAATGKRGEGKVAAPVKGNSAPENEEYARQRKSVDSMQGIMRVHAHTILPIVVQGILFHTRLISRGSVMVSVMSFALSLSSLTCTPPWGPESRESLSHSPSFSSP